MDGMKATGTVVVEIFDERYGGLMNELRVDPDQGDRLLQALTPYNTSHTTPSAKSAQRASCTEISRAPLPAQERAQLCGPLGAVAVAMVRQYEDGCQSQNHVK